MSGVFTAAAALSLIGSGTAAYSQNQNLRKQDSQTAASIINQGKLNSQATSQVSQLNTKIAQANPQDAQKSQTAAYLEALRQANPTQSGVNPAVKGASKRYDQASADSQADVAKYARSTAGNLAATAAPQLQRIGEGNQIADTASNLGLLNDTSASEQGLLRTQLAGDSADPWLGAISGLLQGAGSGLATYGGYKSGGKKGAGGDGGTMPAGGGYTFNT